MELITWIQDNITAIINTMGAVSLFITIMSYRDSKRQKLLGYRLNCNTVISKSMSNISNLEIRYSGKIITDFSISTIIIKNCGISAIEPKGFGSNSHLKITSNGEIFSAIISEGAEVISAS